MRSCHLDEEAPMIFMPKLRWLNLSRCTPFWPIDCPALIELSIIHNIWQPSLTNVNLARLRRLSYGVEEIISQLDVFQAPNLEQLIIQGHSFLNDDYEDLLSYTWINKPADQCLDTISLEIISLRTNIDSELLVRAVSTLTRCTKLRISVGYQKLDFFEALDFPPEVKISTGEPQVPLETLICLYITCMQGRDHTIIKNARQFVRFRKAAGMPLRSVIVNGEVIEDGQ